MPDDACTFALRDQRDKPTSRMSDRSNDQGWTIAMRSNHWQCSESDRCQRRVRYDGAGGSKVGLSNECPYFLLEGGRSAVELCHLLHRRRSIVSFQVKQKRKRFDKVMGKARHRNDRVEVECGECQDRSPATGQIPVEGRGFHASTLSRSHAPTLPCLLACCQTLPPFPIGAIGVSQWFSRRRHHQSYQFPPASILLDDDHRGKADHHARTLRDEFHGPGLLGRICP